MNFNEILQTDYSYVIFNNNGFRKALLIPFRCHITLIYVDYSA